MSAELLRKTAIVCGILASVAIGSAIGDWLADDAAAQNSYNFDHSTFYDNTTPGVSQNIQETFCVTNESTEPDSATEGYGPLIGSWLNDPAGWESVGIAKADFVYAASCSTATIIIKFYDETDPDFCDGRQNLLGCAPIKFGASVSVDGHNHTSGSGMSINATFWVKQTTSDDRRRNLINHEMGHVFGLEHEGPMWGRMGFGIENVGAIHDGNFGPYLPSESEIYQARSHFNGVPSPALAPCIGFPSPDRIHVSWFDTAIDDESNSVTIRRWAGGGEWIEVPMPEMTTAGIPDFGNRVSLLSNPISDIDHLWLAQPDVLGGPRHQVNWDPVIWSIHSVSPLGPAPQSTCTVKVEPSDNAGELLITWRDASFNEDDFAVYYQFPGDNGYLSSTGWFLAMDCAANTEACTDVSTAGNFGVGDSLCVIMRARNGFGSGPWSNAACTRVIGGDSDFDGYTDLVEALEPLCAEDEDSAQNDDGRAVMMVEGTPVPQADDSFVNDGCPAKGGTPPQPETGTDCENATDDDGDDYVNDGCPTKGLWSEGQFNIGTDQQERCGMGFDPGPSGAWPADLVSGSIPNSTDRVNILDQASFVTPKRRLGTSPGHDDFDPRWDLRPGPGILSVWINILDLAALTAPGSPENNPPMYPFYGTPAWLGPACTDLDPPP